MQHKADDMASEGLGYHHILSSLAQTFAQFASLGALLAELARAQAFALDLSRGSCQLQAGPRQKTKTNASLRTVHSNRTTLVLFV